MSTRSVVRVDPTTVDEETAQAARRRLQAARASAIASVTPYFGNALSSMVMREVPGLGTVATDTRWRFYYDPHVVAKWSMGVCVAAWLHELKHNLHRHSDRFAALGRPADLHLLFNVAGDALINEDLADLARTAHMPGRGPALELGPDWIRLRTLPVPAERSMTTEEIFALLERGRTSCPIHGSGDEGSESDGADARSQVSAEGGSGTVADGPAVVAAEGSTPHRGRATAACRPACTCPVATDCGSGAGSGVNRWWELPQDDGSDGSLDSGRGDLVRHDAARQVLAQSRKGARGSIPAGIRLWAERQVDPVVDWRQQLRSVVSNRCASVAGRRDYTYSRPSRRARVGGVILPSMREPVPPRGAVVLDTSGSMTAGELAQGLAEIEGILKQVSRGRSELKVVTCDASASEAATVRSPADVALVGGGGTDMTVGMEAAAALRPAVDFVVVFTDGETPWPSEPPRHNRSARYIAVLSAGPRQGVPDWMTTIVVDPRQS